MTFTFIGIQLVYSRRVKVKSFSGFISCPLAGDMDDTPSNMFYLF